MSTTAASFTPKASSTGEPVRLAMQRFLLTGQVLPAGARVTVQHIFQSEEEKPLEVIYSFPLPRDAALRRFRITGDGFEAHSELKETAAAVKAYEEGIAQGALSTLARQYGDGLVNLTVGNIRPKETVTVWLEILTGVELKDDGFRFRFPFTLAPAYHARSKAARVGPAEGEMELPADEFGDVILPRFREDASALHQIGFDLSLPSQLELDEVASPSHSVRVKQNGGRGARVSLATEKDVPNRDLVLDGRFKTIAPQVLAGLDKEGKTHFAAILPSTSFGANPETPRRVVILLDRSGSMQGAPISQARKAIDACLGLLSDADSFGVVAFDTIAEVFEPALLPGTREARDRAHAFLERVDARGGTELATGFLAAAKLLEGCGGDILIMTDGQVAGTETILAEARTTGVVLHCLGIGSASQDRFLTLLARETGGVSRFVTPRERVDLSAVDLFASIGRPVASGLKAQANIQPQPPSCVFSGTPVLLFGEGVLLFGEGNDNIELTWDGGRLNLPVSPTDDGISEIVRLLQGSRLITDWESRYPSVQALAPLERRQENRVAMRLRELSQTYGLASREMSLVAVVKRAGDRPGALPETRVVPVGMAQDTIFDAYFAAGRAHLIFGAATNLQMARASFATFDEPQELMCLDSAAPQQNENIHMDAYRPGPLERLKLRISSAMKSAQASPEQPTPQTPDDALLKLASRMESDGGMPGKDPEARAVATANALLAFLSQGHTPSSGVFRSHVARLVKFLQSLGSLSAPTRQLVHTALEAADTGKAPSGDWLAKANAV